MGSARGLGRLSLPYPPAFSTSRGDHGLTDISMTSEESRLPAGVMQAPADARPALPSDDRFSTGLRGFGPLGILAILVIAVGTLVSPLVGAVLVLGWAWRSHTPWHEIRYVSPKSWSVC